MRRYIPLIPALVASVTLPATAQEFDLDLTFDDDEFFEEAAVAADVGGPDISVTFSYGASHLSGTTTQTSGLRFDIADRHDLGVLGFLEWSGFAAIDDPTGARTTSIGIEKVHLQNSSGNVSWKVGKFSIGWGEVEGMPVLDVLNSSLSLATLGTSFSDLPGQWFASADIFSGKTTYSGFVGLDPDVAAAGPIGTHADDMEIGLRASFPIENGQISIYAAQLMPQAGVFDQASGTSSAQPYTLVGVSAHKALNSVLLEFDLAAKSGLERSTAAGLSSHDRVDAALGVEIAASTTTQISASVAVQHWASQTAVYFDEGLGGPVPSPQTSANYLLGVTKGFSGSDLGLSLYYGGAVNGSTKFAAVNFDYPVSDQFSLSASLSKIWANPGSLLSPIDGTQSVTIGAEVFF